MPWKGAGIAIPVFSLRSENGLGIGEFTDLKLLVDWAGKTRMKLVQILPVNDTIATKTWTDSYPYAAISVFALHPLYVNIQAISKLKDKKAETALNKVISELNALQTVDFEQVLQYKFQYFKLLFDQEKDSFFKNKEAQKFISDNEDWLKPYAAFCHLRDLNNTTNFYTWKQYSTFSPQVVADLCTPQYKRFDEVALYYFIQFHAHQQLFGATEYARSKGVILKGDLPIGIYRYSCDGLYDDYFFQRHDEFWKQQALWKLPALVRATNMLICGEDLGMIPKSVPGVMNDLNIIALEIQRMPKGATDFGETTEYPYMTVCSPSCHDMSTVRGWWESDYAQAQKFYEKNLKRYDTTPSVCTPEIVKAINKQHFDAPSMWAIFPIQDLVGMDEKLRRIQAKDEQINEPRNPQHYWRFRFHLNMENLLKEYDLNEKIASTVVESGR